MMKRFSSTLLLTVVLSFASHATEPSVADQYAMLKQQFSQWLVNQKMMQINYKLNAEITLDDKHELISGAQIRYNTQANECISYAPHRFFDKHTFAIASALSTQCQVFITNTAHRNNLNKLGEKSDLGKSRYSVANAFIEAYASTVPSTQIYQIHGFDASKRRTKQAQSLDVIISQGARPPSEKIKQISQCLNDKVKFKSAVYPLDVSELGGTKNILNTLTLPKNEFFHIELSYSARKKLIQQSNLMSGFKKCITL
ncbi:hypothetical protein NQT69_07515 [Pseudoalteromonas shioyasakiensis]|uniref:hypothetical protein n=1 Tax=Pseudoalteromonas shioyasakiensis TaxID=1190813 RepID=UPI0021176834|nr:hypothetical protein [Pseudoalteromonas shioyasakiensis]MCQ8877844.1 hypothetical protein [Pseudoalteromonas shioyasakiensis]